MSQITFMSSKMSIVDTQSMVYFASKQFLQWNVVMDDWDLDERLLSKW